MTKPTEEEIERADKEMRAVGCIDGFYGIALWHLKKMAEQKAKYERLVKAAKGLLTRTDWAPAEIDDLIEALQSLEKSESKGK